MTAAAEQAHSPLVVALAALQRWVRRRRAADAGRPAALGIATRGACAPRVLPAREFEAFLERERQLADRGTRLFSLLTLHRRSGHRHDLPRLARQLGERLRSTDLVGQLQRDRLAVLLTDTGPAGARAVAAWVDGRVAELGLDVEATIYVYPSVGEAASRASTEARGDEPPRGGAPASAQGGGGAAVDARSGPANVGATAAACSAARWPLEDLWPQLWIPLPVWKRCLDILVSALALVVLAPLFVLVALAIRIDSPGPAIFRQMRAGRGARPFVLYKFRSMHADAEQRRSEVEGLNEQRGPVFKIRDDPRITRVGRLLRRSSIDELPQLWNTLKGDISLVGPRSPTFNEITQYERWQRRRLSVTGGITCVWQVSGRSQVEFRDWMRMDLRYITRGGPWLDLQLLLRTVPAVVSGRGAC